MNIAIPQRRNYLANIANQIAQNPAIIQGAQQIGRFGAQQLREAYNNYNREVVNYEEAEEHGDNKRAKSEEMSANENNMDTGQADSSRMGNSSSNGGPRGAFVGNTQSITGYEKYYHEKQMGHSKKQKILFLTWGLSIYGPRNRVSGNAYPFLKWGTTGPNGLAIPGIVATRTVDIFGNSTINAFTPYGSSQNNTDFSENIYANAINFYLGDFIDNKLMDDSGRRGFFLNYNKFRLVSFTVHLTPKTRNESMLQHAPNVFNSGRGSNGWQGLLAPDEKGIFINYKHPWYEETENPGYFIHRDIFNSYSTTGGTIPIIPNSANANAGDDIIKREQFVIKNLDHNLTFIKSGETFSFTREIKAQGNYYFERAGILSNLKTPIGNIVNQLEGQIQDGSTIVKKNPEGFNILIVPGRAKIEMFGEIALGGTPAQTNPNVPENRIGNGYLMIPAITTELIMKTTAIWEAFDYNYVDNSVARMTDPLEQAIFESNVEATITKAHLNRGIY